MNQEKISFTTEGKIRDIGEMLTEMDLDRSDQVYRHLLSGKSMSVEHFAHLLSKSLSEAKEILVHHGELSKENEVVRFLGISLVETQHKLILDNQIIYTWCAADTLLFPSFLDFSAKVESKDPISGEIVKLSVNGDHLKWTDPVPIYISSVDKADSCDIRNSFCNHTHFFASEQNAKIWLETNPEANISSVDEFFDKKSGMSCC